LKKDKEEAIFRLFLHSAQMYLKYIDIYKKLEECYDQMVHPQKKVLLKEMLENTMVRLVEVKQVEKKKIKKKVYVKRRYIIPLRT
jgi:hypothetical protein